MILDTQVLEVIKNNPGVTAYDIRNEYLVGYKIVGIRRAVNRLLSKNKIEVVGLIRQGKTRSSYYNKLEALGIPKPKPLSPLGKQVYSNPVNRLLNGQW